MELLEDESYPGYEKQGSNLTIEVIFRGVLQYLKDKEMKSIRNLYVQLDNYSINKSYCVLAVSIVPPWYLPESKAFV